MKKSPAGEGGAEFPRVSQAGLSPPSDVHGAIPAASLLDSETTQMPE
jgi:hypothetical protein